MTDYGHGRFSIDSQTAGKVRLTSITVAPALAPRLRFGFAWSIGHLAARAAGGAPTEYRVASVHGELLLAMNGPAVGELRQSLPHRQLRSLAYVDDQALDLIIDLDWFRFERLEEYRQGAALELHVQLSTRIEGEGRALEALVDPFRIRVPREDWLAVIGALTGDRTELLEVRYSLTYAGTFRPSLEELRLARAAADRGEYTSAVVAARKAVLLIEAALTSVGKDPKEGLAALVDTEHADIYGGIASRLKRMGNIQVHQAGAVSYTRAEALFSVRLAELFAELVGALLARPPRPPRPPAA